MIPFYIGTYTDGTSKGIYRLQLDPVTAQLSTPVLAAEAVNPSFLAWHPSRRVVYSVREIHDAAAGTAGALVACTALEDGCLEAINEQPTGGLGACFVSVHPAGTHAFVANYRSGSVAVFPIRTDGGVAPLTALVQHAGSSSHPARQTRPYAHSIRPAPGDRFVVAADLGADKLFVYRFDGQRGTLTPHEPPSTAASAGAGPRHIALHPSGDAVFVINELDSTIASYAWDGARGRLDLLGVASTLPEGFTGENTTAEVVIHPAGRFVYGSNRGHDSIVAFRINQDYTLMRVGLYSTGGRTPRHFAIDPGGDFLLAANQESDQVVLFRIDRELGGLAGTGARVSVPSPAFVGVPTT